MRVDVLDGSQWIGDEVLIVDVDELRGIVVCACTVELLEPPGPQFELTFADHLVGERVRPTSVAWAARLHTDGMIVVGER